MGRNVYGLDAWKHSASSGKKLSRGDATFKGSIQHVLVSVIDKYKLTSAICIYFF